MKWIYMKWHVCLRCDRNAARYDGETLKRSNIVSSSAAENIRYKKKRYTGTGLTKAIKSDFSLSHGVP
jgi:hypothetical protein